MRDCNGVHGVARPFQVCVCVRVGDEVIKILKVQKDC